MSIIGDLPMGFGMALMQNPDALKHFETLSRDKQQAIVAGTSQVASKNEMKSYVSSIISTF